MSLLRYATVDMTEGEQMSTLRCAAVDEGEHTTHYILYILISVITVCLIA
jgi:hypothetical protein